jgi:parallel beta-helix repeat protein
VRWICVIAALFCWPIYGLGAGLNADLYVSPSGNDHADGSKKHPWKTLQRAVENVMPGTTIHVMAGTYNSSSAFKTTASGIPGYRIRYVSDEKWGAKLRSSETGISAVWWNQGSYVDIEGFDISGSGSVGIYNTGSFTRIIGNHVHDIPASGCPAYGGAGIDNGNYSATDNDITGNTVHDIGDFRVLCLRVHGIYHSTLRGNITGNISYHNQGWGIHLWHAANSVTIADNEVFDNSYGGIVVGADAADFPGRFGSNDHTVVSNNKVYRNGLLNGAKGNGIEEYGAVGDHNRYENNIVYENRPADWNLKNKSLQQELSRAR